MTSQYASIATAPRDGAECFLIDVFADTPEWSTGFWIEEYGAYFGGSHNDYEMLCAEIEAGEAEPEELECAFWSQPTHWAPMLPVPTLCN